MTAISALFILLQGAATVGVGETIAGPGEWLKLIPVDWQGIMAILEVLLLFNILQEARKNKRDIQMRVRSERLQFYAFFWKKWDRILEALPHGIFEPDFDASAQDRETLMVTLRSYFDLCAQEYFMYTEGVIEESIWANWRRGLISCMSLPIFQEAYAQLKVEMSHPEFHEWLAGELSLKNGDVMFPVSGSPTG